MDFMEFIGWVCFFYLGWQLLKSWIFVQQLRHRIEDHVANELELQHAKKQVRVVQFEHVEQGAHSVVLVYEHKTNQFLGQAGTREEAEAMLQCQYPKKQFIVVNEKTISKQTIDPLQTNNG